MTDKELEKKAKTYADEHEKFFFYEDEDGEDIQESTFSSLKNAYIAGAKENAVVWHDLRKNPEDLPKEYTEVLNDDGVKVELRDGHWRYVYGDEWEDDACVDHWCEIPRFEEE